MKANKVDMSSKRETSPCCDYYDPKYPIGFFLNCDQVEELGLQNVEPGQTVEAVVTLVVKSVTKRNGEDADDMGADVECYVNVTEMGILSSAKPSPSQLMSKAYEGEDNGTDAA